LYSIKEGHKASIYMNVPVRLNAISSYQSQQSSPAIRDITVSGHTRHHRLRPYKTSPSPAIQDITVSGHARNLRLRLYKTSPSPAETCICNNGGCSVCECSLVQQNFVTDNLVPRAGSISRAFYASRKNDNLYSREPQRYTLTICQHQVLSTRRDVPGKTTHNRVRIRRDFCSYGTRYSGTLLEKARGFVICGELCA